MDYTLCILVENWDTEGFINCYNYLKSRWNINNLSTNQNLIVPDPPGVVE